MEINLERIKQDIETLASFTATPGEGVTRLPFSREDRLAREYLRGEMEKIGLRVWEDGYSTLFGRREGQIKTPAVLIGSHYDSVINGGPLDGTAGVAAALEIMRVFHENDWENYYPLEITAMNDEEGVRFGSGLGNSRAMAGLLTSADLDNNKDSAGLSIRQAMQEFGFTPDLQNAHRHRGSIHAYLELHIEQGPILEDLGRDVGLVETIVGLERYEVTFQGRPGHAGTTPMLKRQDALTAAAEFVLAVREVAQAEGEGTVGTVGEVRLSPNAPNVIPGKVRLSLDLRSIQAANLERMVRKLKNRGEEVGKRHGVQTIFSPILAIAPVKMDASHLALIERISKQLGYSYLRMNSGAGHDAMIMAEVGPANLIFVPSQGGLSHHPQEWTDYADLAKGVMLMLQAVVELSRVKGGILFDTQKS